jgi:lysyl-tRNA synthetase class 1
MKPTTTEEIPNIHWADHAAEDLIKLHPTKNRLVCASGISPSGTVHIGNFREVITVDFVVRSLKERGKNVRFIYSWDDFDALRKVPANLPQPEMIEKNLRKALARVPDPFGKDASYAAHFERVFEESLGELEVAPEYIRQNVPYDRGDYAEGIRHAVKHQAEIVEILNRSRTEPLPANWTCLSIFCKECGRDTTKLIEYREPFTVKYSCAPCKKEFEVEFDKPGSGVKLLWRVDWPMRWAKEGVDFEPGGKDHSSTGGSFDTGSDIVRKLWNREPPYYVQYDFVLAKGLGSKLSSSSGNLITLDEALAVYEPAVLRWIFASRKPNIDFSIAFDLDVIKAYDDFDRTTRIALKIEEAEEKKFGYEQRIYELSRVAPYPAADGKTNQLAQFPFRHLCNILQIHRGDIQKAKAFFAPQFSGPHDEKRFESRAKRAWAWITQFAPPEFKFSLRDGSMPAPTIKHRAAVEQLLGILEEPGIEKMAEEAFHERIFAVIKGNAIEPKVFFQEIYSILINKTSGPKLASFLLAIEPKQAAELIRRTLTNNAS